MIKPRLPRLELARGWKYASITRYSGDAEGEIHLDRATPRCRSTVMAIRPWCLPGWDSETVSASWPSRWLCRLESGLEMQLDEYLAAFTSSDLMRVQWDERLAFVVAEHHRTLFGEV